MINIIGNEHGDQSSIPGWGRLHFTQSKYPLEKNNFLSFPPS